MIEQTTADTIESAVAAPAKKPAAKKKRGRPAAKKAAKKPAAKKAKAKKPAKKKAAKKPAAKKAAKKPAKKKAAKKPAAKKAKKPAKKKAAKKAKKVKKPNDGAVVDRKGFTNTASSQTEQASTSINNFGTAFMSYAQEQVDDAVSTAQQLLNCRTLEDMATVQSQYVQHSFDRLVKRANKLAQSTANLAKERSEPLNNQLEEFVQRFYRAA